MSGLSLCLLAALGVSRGADRLTNIAALPVVDPGARIGYVGSIDPTGGNADWNWGDRQDKNGEWILFEDTGAGCIYNFTQHRTKRLKTEAGVTRETFPVPTYRFYFDGATTPQFELTPEEFGTKAPFLGPLAGSFVPDIKTADFRIVRSFVPMAYRKSVKVTSTVRLQGKADAGGGWGHVTYHHYDSPEGLATFDGKDDGKALQAEYSVQHQLAHDGVTDIASFSLAGGARREVFAAKGRSTLVLTQLKVGGFASATDLAKDLWIVCSFDGKTTVEAPVGTFFGCEMPAHAAQRRLALLTFDTKSEAGTAILENRFPMPFFSSAKIVLENRGTAALTIEGTVRTNGKLEYDPKTTGLFTASAYCPPTRNVAGRNARIGELVGRGQMAYGTVSLRNATVRGCEGDVRCYIDDRETPRVQSDGSESWGSWGWGFCKPPQTQPFAAYDSPVTDNTSWSQVRLLLGDSYPFQMRLRFEIEHGDCNDLAGSESSGQVFGYVIRPAASSLTLTSPAAAATVPALSDALKAYNAAASTFSWQTYQSTGGDYRASLSSAYAANDLPVTLAWSGAEGTAKVTVRRLRDGKVFFSKETAGSSVAVYDLPIGYNYLWTVDAANGTATGRFFVERVAPRIMNVSAYSGVNKVANARDLGGWTTASGQVVKQGLIYRSRQFDWCRGKPAADYWADTLGIRLDVDLRGDSDIDECVAGYGGSRTQSPLSDSIERWASQWEKSCGVSFGDYGSMVTSSDNRKAFGFVFLRLADPANLPAVFHCAHGKDRTGSLAFVLNGLLGVPLQDLRLDWAYSWAYKSEWTLSAFSIDQLTDALKTRYGSSDVQANCAAYVKECLQAAGQTAAAADATIAAFREMMLEEPEAAFADEVHTHSWGDWSADTATKAAAGSQTRRCTCADCDASETRQTPQRWDWLLTDGKGYCIIKGYRPNLAKGLIDIRIRFTPEQIGAISYYYGLFVANARVGGSADYGNAINFNLEHPARDGFTGSLCSIDYYNNPANSGLTAPDQHVYLGYNGDVATPHNFTACGMSLSVDGKGLADHGHDDVRNVQTDSDLYLFTTGTGKQPWKTANMTRGYVYGVTLGSVDGATTNVVHRYRPARKDGVATLWDEVTGEFLAIANGGTFTVGNDETEPEEEPDIPGSGTPTLTSPGNYASVATLNAAVKAFNALPTDTKAGMMAGDADNGDADRAALRKAYKEDLPVVRLAWTGTTGTCLVKVYRERDNKIVFDGKSSDGTAAFWDPEIGRNYRWTVTCGENVAEGYFHTESEGPRLINEKYGKVRNARDFGGWTTVDGKVVRQGILFRSASVDEFEGVGNACCTGTLGVRFDLDLRSKQELIDDGIAKVGGDIRISPLGAGVVRWNSEDRLGDGVAFMDTYSNIFNPNSTSWKHQKAFWNDFVQLNADANLPAVFHCSAGRDRTGCLAYVMGAVLGVGEADLATDFYTSWASQGYPHDYSKTNKWLPQFVSDLKSKYAGATLKEKAEAVLIQCCRTAGGTEAEAKSEIEKFRTRMLETKENPHLAPGQEPQKWDWLQTDSKGYIRTGYVPKLRWTKIETKVQFLEFSGNCAVYSANAVQNLTAPRNAYGNLLLLESNDGGTAFDYNNLAKDLPANEQKKPGCRPAFDADITRPHVFVTYNNKIWIDGNLTEGANDANDVEASSDLLLFTTSYTKDSNGKDRSYLNQSRKKVYYLRIWEVDASGGERLVHSYRPAKDENGAATLYDEVAGVCLPVVNGGGFTVGNDVDATQVSIDEGLSGDAVAIPSGAAVSLSDGCLVVNGRTYAPKAHYVFKETAGGYALEIAQEEAVVAGFEIAADGTVSVTSDKAFGNFWYALEHAGTPFFGLSSRTLWQKLTADDRTLTAPQQGDQRFYRLLVTDRPE